MPWHGSGIPNVGKFFLDLQIVATIILIQSIIVNIFSTNSQKPIDLIEKFNQIFTRYRFVEVIAKPVDKLPQDVSALIEDLNKQTTKENIRMTFCRIIDCFCFLLAFITFVTMFWSLFPRGYFSSNYNPLETLS